MTINTMTPKPAKIAEDGTVPLTPEQIVEQLRMLRQHIPDFGPLPVPDARSLRRTAHVDADFMQASINTISASVYMRGAIGRKPETISAERDDVNRWSGVEDELRAMLQGVAAANLSRRHRIGLLALQTYSISRQLVRNPEHADLLPHVETMRRLNKFGRRRQRPRTDEQPAAQPVVPAPDARKP